MPRFGSHSNARFSGARARRVAAVLSITAIGATGAIVAPAQAGLLSGVLPNLGGTVTQTGQTLGGLVPVVGGVVTGVTGTVGGVIGGVQDTVTGTVDSTLGGVLDGVTGATGGVLPTATLDALLGTLTGSDPSGTVGGVVGTVGGLTGTIIGGHAVGPNGVIDASAPRPTIKVLSKLTSIGKTGKLKIQVKTNEAGIVALAGNVRPGLAVKKKGKKAGAHSRKLIKVPSVILGYRGPGTLTLTVKLSRAAQRVLGSSRGAVASVGTVASDVNRNQASDTVRIKIKR